mgnify:CR=1 FL=1
MTKLRAVECRDFIKAVIEKAEAMRVQTGGMGGAFVWPSLIRKLDKLDESYKS